MSARDSLEQNMKFGNLYGRNQQQQQQQALSDGTGENTEQAVTAF